MTVRCYVCDMEFATAHHRGGHEGGNHKGMIPKEERIRRSREQGRARYARRTPEEKWVFTANHRARFQQHADPISPDAAWPFGPCHYCGGPQDGFDHVVPFSLDGRHVLENIVSSCWPCNLRKANRGPEVMLVPAYVDLLCGWCWAPVRRRTSSLHKIIQSVACPDHVVTMHTRHKLPFGKTWWKPWLTA